MKRTALAVIVTITLLLAGCSTQGTGTTESPPSGTNRPADASDTSAESAALSSPSADDAAASANPKFGDTYTWKDGLAVTISVPTPYTPSESAAADPPPPRTSRST